jgi:phosphoribosylaminoimidazole-succinocarboxamide synthase
LVSGLEIVKQGLMSQQDWDYVAAKALELFNFASTKALERGLILVDTKLEFGKLEDGTIVVADEMFTPDSSRYWMADTYNERFQEGREPENIDKEFLRLWFIANCDPYNDKVLPLAPDDLIVELSGKYIQLYEMITNHNFPFPELYNSFYTACKLILPQSAFRPKLPLGNPACPNLSLPAPRTICTSGNLALPSPR